MVKLYPYQEEAIKNLQTGSILCGGVGSGKSLTALEYFKRKNDRDIYVITTAKKRNSGEWDDEFTKEDLDDRKAVVDSWNNIHKYLDVSGADFIFDEQRVIGNGAWVKSFLRIVKNNDWILLSATPGDTWTDYIPVFIANGFYKNRTEFIREHVIYAPWTQFRKVTGYICEQKLERLRRKVLVNMDFERPTERHKEIIIAEFDKNAYRNIMKTRWNDNEERPIESASELCQLLRRVCNVSTDRKIKLIQLVSSHQRVIIFYNYIYEKIFIKEILEELGCSVSEYNGQKHDELPSGDRWCYLVQYAAGCEGWNCTTTDTVIFWSYSYSYRMMEQACGRIDRVNTPYKNLYYYYICTNSVIDRSIRHAVNHKRLFNESGFVKLQKKHTL